MRKLKYFEDLIYSINKWISKVVSFLILPMVGIILYEITMRYFLNLSQEWTPEIISLLFSIFIIMSGGYILAEDGHVRLDIIYDRFSAKGKLLLDLITAFFFFIFCGVLLWKGWLMAWPSLISMERSSSAFAFPLFPYKILIPIGAALLLLQGLTKFISNLFALLSGEKT